MLLIHASLTNRLTSLFPNRADFLHRSPSQWAAKDHGLANNLRWTLGRNPPGIGRALASIRSFCTPWGEKVPAGGMRGQPARHALCHTPTNHPALSPSPQPSPTVTRVRLLESRLVGEGATRGGAAGLAADLLHQPTRGRWSLGRPQARRGGYHADHQATWIGQPRCVPNQRHPPARARAQDGGSADLRVCSAGPGSNENESLGSQESWIAKRPTR